MPLFLLDEEGKHSDRRYDEHSSKKGGKFCIITLDGYDLYFIINKKKDDPMKIFTFDFTFTKEHICNAW